MKRSHHWLWLLLLVPIGLGLARVRFDVEVLNLLPERSRIVQGLKLYQEHFANARELIVAIEATDPDQARAAAETLANALNQRPDLVRHATWQPPWQASPSQSAEFVAFLWLNQPTPAWREMLERLQGPELTNALREAKTRLATSFSPQELAVLGYDPLRLTQLPQPASSPSFGSGDSLFASPDGAFRVLFVEAASHLDAYQDCIAWLKTVRSIEAGLRAAGHIPTEVAVSYTGRPAFVAEIAGGMERDMNLSIAGTMVIISVLFYLFHRRWKPLLWLIALLLVILGTTMALGALVFQTLSVISLGFAAILLGLTADYALVLYHEAQAHPESSTQNLRRSVGPSILWSAITTAGAFSLLNLSSLPGLSQLGTLVAIGVLVGSAIMLAAFLAPLGRQPSNPLQSPAKSAPSRPPSSPAHRTLAWILTALVLTTALVLGVFYPPRFDHTADALRPSDSPAYETIEIIKSRLERPQEPIWLLVPGQSPQEVADKLALSKSLLETARNAGAIESFTLPDTVWPRPDRQQSHLQLFRQNEPQLADLRAVFDSQGFTARSFALTEGILRTWQEAEAATNVWWPTNAASQWILGQLTSRGDGAFLALGLIHLPAGRPAWSEDIRAWQSALAEAGTLLSGWELLGPALFSTVQVELKRVLWPMAILLTICLGLAFRGFRGILLTLATITVSAAGLSLVMLAADWSWHLMNLMALPLLLGVGVDYSIHMQLALRRHGGDVRFVRRTTGRALLLCAMTTATGFGSLGLSANAGLAGLGQVCAVGLICCYLTAVHALPVWWTAFHRKKTPTSNIER